MTGKSYFFSSESVSEGHPDKVADQLSDAILDAHLSKDSKSRVACEVLVKNETVIIGGEITSNAKVDYNNLIREVIKDIGYAEPELGFDWQNCEIMPFISQQSNDISMGVTEGEGLYKEQGAGDQGLMFGFACDETPECMPLGISLMHKIMLKLAEKRKGGVSFIKPDSKGQITLRYVDGKPVNVETVVVSTQHSPDVPKKKLDEFVIEEVVKAVIPDQYLNGSVRYLINPTGRFVVGGPVGDCGVTGRKIIVDTYGGYARHGGGAFSGKDPSKVDRSAAYMARYVAKNIVSSGIAKRCEVQLAYAIGVAEPVSVYVDTFGTSQVPEDRICQVVREVFSLTPRGIIESLELQKPIYLKTASYGHFGRTPTPEGHFSWERDDKAQELKSLLK
ncbi:MAG: methionine adenosyltransferase [SAR324 cluster bacterium]|uniref:S-adenosylmethionine synthase n=1 Tax=SAR324 cluster bacterium TaxID=2024889 RepID=A0A7X9IKY9_9DELT|nr:methionine adenosyltransferase [SAR324 cluster bacterium]